MKNKILFYIKEYIKVLYSNKFEFFLDSYSNKSKNKQAICIGFSPWKQEYIKEYLPEFSCAFTKYQTPSWKLIQLFDKIEEDYEVFIWSYKESKKLKDYFGKKNILVTRVEDGFIRSIGLGLHETKPLSLVFDSKGLYFNSSCTSNLETILLTKAVHYSNDKIGVAKRLIKKITTKGISKYNFDKKEEKLISIQKNKKIILIIGQVEDDMSIKYGCSKEMTNLDLLNTASNEHPNDYLIYKPHPDTLTGIREVKSPLSTCKKYVSLIDAKSDLHSLIKISDHIYTITSLSGFEALMYNKKVTCFGSPFYSGYGLTDDRDERDKKIRVHLTLEQLFYATYVEYPKYILGDIEATIKYIENKG